jgi:hypothetical protein
LKLACLLLASACWRKHPIIKLEGWRSGHLAGTAGQTCRCSECDSYCCCDVLPSVHTHVIDIGCNIVKSIQVYNRCDTHLWRSNCFCVRVSCFGATIESINRLVLASLVCAYS